MATKSKSTSSSRISMVIHSLTVTWAEFCHLLKDNHKDSARHLSDLNTSCSKLQQLLSTQEKCCRMLFSGHKADIPLLFDILQYFSKVDHIICTCILDCLHCLCNTAKRVTYLSEMGLVCVLTDCLVNATNTFFNLHEASSLEDLFYFFHYILNKLAKDKRLVTISRLSGAVSASVVVLKNYDSSGKVFHVVLNVMKIYSSSPASCSIMARGSVIPALIKLIPSCGNRKIQLLKMSLELLSTLCKSKTGAKKAVSMGAIPTLLELYHEWQKVDHRNRQITLRKAILNVIKTLIGYAFGRKSFSSADGFRTLYFLGLEGIESRECEPLIKIVSVILRKCVKSKKIALTKQSSVYSVTLPQSMESLLSASEGFGEDRSASDSDAMDEDIQPASSDEEEAYTEDEMEHPPTTPVQSSTALAAHLTTATTFQEPSYNANTEHNSKNHYSNNSDDVTAIASHHSSSSTSTAGGSNESESSLHSLCDTERFREFLQELDLYEDDDVHQSIHIPTASLETSFQSVEKANSLNGNCDFDGKTTCSHQLITTSEKNNKSNASGGGSSPLLERLKKFHIGRNHGKCTEPEENSSFRDRPRTTVHSTARMWSVEQSRVCPTLHNDSTSSVLNQSGSTFNQLNCRIQHVSEFVKIPEPTTLGHYPPSTLEPLLPRKTNLQKQMLFTDLSRQIFPDRVIKRVVYDLDELTKNTPPVTPNVSATNLLSSPPTSTNRIVPVLRKSQSAPKLSIHHLNAATLQRISKEDVANSKPLSFESRFECGNLRKAIQIRQYEYDLILNSDTNTCGHHQWFYFQVQNMEVNVEYRFNIINCEKPNSQFNYGMTSLMYSVVNAKRGNPSWHRTGTNVCYYRNYFVRGVGSSKSYFTATFTISFPHKNDTCFLAYHYPYSLSMLKMDVLRMEASLCQHIIYSNQVLCQTLGGNDVNLLTITNPSISATRRDIIKRPYVVLTARVHPGESNSSWIMKGILDFLTSSDTLARQLRSIYIFKIVPMLNPDGVVNGCHRCSLTGQDLNRQWKHPDPILHPSIYHVKTLIQSMTAAGKKPMLFVDFHGHSRKKNVFMYGCQEKQPETTLSATDERGDSLQTSCNSSSKSKGSTSMSSTTFRDDRSSYCSNLDFYNEDSVIKLFPRILSSVSPYFSLQNCNYAMEKSKEATARIVGFRELGIDRSYTLESSYSGMDQGEYAGYHVGTTHLEDMGRTFCRALFKFAMCPNVDTNDFTN